MAANQISEYEFFGAAADLTVGRMRYHDILKIYRHISVFDVKWNTTLESIPRATDAQIQKLISDSNDPTFQQALERMILSDSPYFNISMTDGGSDMVGKVIMSGVKIDGMRNLFICKFDQCVAISTWGLIMTVGLGAAVSAIFNPIAGFLSALSKLAVDYKVSKEVVAIVAGLKYLEERGLIRIAQGDGNFRVLMGRNLDL